MDYTIHSSQAEPNVTYIAIGNDRPTRIKYIGHIIKRGQRRFQCFLYDTPLTSTQVDRRRDSSGQLLPHAYTHRHKAVWALQHAHENRPSTEAAA